MPKHNEQREFHLHDRMLWSIGAKESFMEEYEICDECGHPTQTYSLIGSKAICWVCIERMTKNYDDKICKFCGRPIYQAGRGIELDDEHICEDCVLERKIEL